jgi:sodium pump decarboxylase gamma subunit
MTISEMFQQSAILTVLGMATVFIFLWLMIICVNLVSKIIHHFGLDKDLQEQPPAPGGPKSGTSPKITAVISAAVSKFRASENEQ